MGKSPKYLFKKDENDGWHWLCPICNDSQGPFDGLELAKAAASLHNFKH